MKNLVFFEQKKERAEALSHMIQPESISRIHLQIHCFKVRKRKKAEAVTLLLFSN